MNGEPESLHRRVGETHLPTQKYTMSTFIDEAGNGSTSSKSIRRRSPTAATANPARLLDIALGSDIELDHACGGVCACATCHVIVKQGLESCSEPTDDEEDQLDAAYGLTEQSRLACQCVPDGTADLLVVVPNWNRNRAREAH